MLGFLGQKIGEIADNPKNRDDADYKQAVLNALKKMDKSITLQELNEKLTRTVAEPDAPDSDNEEDLVKYIKAVHLTYSYLNTPPHFTFLDIFSLLIFYPSLPFIC